MVKKIAITGPIGSGKTHISNLFIETIGIPVFYSDTEAKKLYVEDEYVKSEMSSIFGPATYNWGEFNSELVANIIFTDDKYMRKVTHLIKGPLLRKFYDWFYKIRYNPFNEKPTFTLYESAVMSKETYCMFDHIFIVDADIKIRKVRVSKRSGLIGEKFKERNSRQPDTEEIITILDKLEIPYTIINNDGVADLIPIIKEIAITHGWEEGNKNEI